MSRFGETGLVHSLSMVGNAVLRGLIIAALSAGLAGIGSAANAQTLTIDVAQGAFEDKRIVSAVNAAVGWYEVARRNQMQLDAVVLRRKTGTTRLDPTGRDLRLAKRLKAEAGYGDKPLPYFIFHDAASARLAALAMARLKEAGFEGKRQEVTKASLRQAISLTRYVTSRNTVEFPYLVLTLDKATRPDPQKLADLVAEIDLAVFNAGRQQIDLQVTVTNRGTVSSGSSLLAIRAQNTSFRGDLVEVEPILPRSSKTLKHSIRIPQNVLGQTLTLQAVVDVRGQVRELNEENNISKGKRVRTAQQRQPADLVVLGGKADFDPQDGVLRVEFTVSNEGGSVADRHMLQTVEQSGNVRFPPLAIDAIKPGERRAVEQAVQLPSRLLGQTLTLVARIDAENQIKEGNERNNDSQPLRITIDKPRRYPDLVVSIPEAKYDPDTQRIRLRLTVTNQGGETAGAHAVQVTESNGLIDSLSEPVAGIGAGASRSVFLEGQVPVEVLGRALVFQAQVDPRSQVREENEKNNFSAVVRLQVPAPRRFPDLTIESIRPEFDPRDQILTLRVMVANRGDEIAAFNRLEVTDLTGTFPMPSVPVEPLGPGQKREVIVRAPFPDNAFDRDLALQGKIDAADEIPESEEGNNLSKKLFTRLDGPEPLADLVVGRPDVTFDPDRKELAIRVVVENLGGVIAASHQLSLIDHSGMIDISPERVGPIEPGQVREVRRSVRMPDQAAGQTLVLQAIIDAQREVAEADEGNNESERIPFTPDIPQELADLYVDIVRLVYDRQSQELSIRLIVENAGSQEAPRHQLTLIDHRGLMGFPLVSVDVIGPGQTRIVEQTLKVPAAVQGQTIDLQAEIDSQTDVPESNEDNNQSPRQSVVIEAPVPSSNALQIPLEWIAIGVAGGAILASIAGWRRARTKTPGTRSEPPDTPNHAMPVQVSYLPRSDPGHQQIERVDGGPAVILEVSVRPVRDPGIQTVSNSTTS